MKLTKIEAQEVSHKLWVLADSQDLRADYGLSEADANGLASSVPPCGGEWIIPAGCEDAVKGEMADHVIILRGQADDARDNDRRGEALAIDRLAARLERKF